MRIAYLIAGAGGMYCGSCMRDNRIAATLIELGHNVVLLPLYTPIRTDEDDVSRLPVHYGGIRLYLEQKSRLFRRVPGFMQHWLDASSVLRFATRFAVKTDAADLGSLTLAILEPDSSLHAERLPELVNDLKALNPDVVHLPNLLFAGMARALRDGLGVPVVCTMAGEDVFLDELPAADRVRTDDLIRQGVADIDGFIAPTSYYGSAMIERFGIDAAHVHDVPLGIHCEESAAVQRTGDAAFVIGYLARIAPEKGLAELAEAFILLCQAGHDCRLHAAGYLAAGQSAYLEGVRQRVREAGLAERFTYAGEVDREHKLSFLRSVDCLSVPAPYPEAKGLYVLEALMAGVPVVLPERGAFPELIERTGGGLLCAPDSAQALADALAKLIRDPQHRAELGRRGREAVCQSFTAEVMAGAAWDVFQHYAGMARGEREATPARGRGPR